MSAYPPIFRSRQALVTASAQFRAGLTQSGYSANLARTVTKSVTGMAAIRKRGGKWQAQVRKAGALPQSKTFETKAAAARWARRIEHDIDEGRARGGIGAAGTLAELLDRYEREIDPIKRFGRTKASSLSIIKRGLGATRLRDLDAAAVIKFARMRHKDGAGPVTVAIDLSYLGTVLRTARALWRLAISDEPVREAREALRMVGLVGKAAQRTRRPTTAELDRLFAYWRSNARMKIPMPDLVEFAIASGMRDGEICRIARSDLKPDVRTIIIRDRKDPRAKAGNDEEVPLLDVTGFDALAIIQRQPVNGDRIFPYKAASVSTAFSRACDALGIVDLHLHDMRHEAASRMFEAGLQIHEVALVTGHRDWRTLRGYTQLRPSDITAAFPSLGPQASDQEPRRDRTPSGQASCKEAPSASTANPAASAHPRQRRRQPRPRSTGQVVDEGQADRAEQDQTSDSSE